MPLCKHRCGCEALIEAGGLDPDPAPVEPQAAAVDYYAQLPEWEPCPF